MTDLKQEFWDRLDDITAGMLSADGAPPRPMAHQLRKGDHAIWFITDEDTDIGKAAQGGAKAQHIVACAHGKLYAAIDGVLSVETSKEVLDDIWSPMAAVWFEDGREDDDIRLVKFTPTKAEVWTTDGAAKSLYEFAKAGLSDDAKPDVGEHGHLTF